MIFNTRMRNDGFCTFDSYALKTSPWKQPAIGTALRILQQLINT